MPFLSAEPVSLAVSSFSWGKKSSFQHVEFWACLLRLKRAAAASNASRHHRVSAWGKKLLGELVRRIAKTKWQVLSGFAEKKNHCQLP